jgi:hypothetical protein
MNIIKILTLACLTGTALMGGSRPGGAPNCSAPPEVTTTSRSRFRSCVSWPSVIVRTYAANIGR